MEKELTRQEQEEIFIRIYNQTGVQKEAAEAVHWDKSKAWRFVKKLKEKEPERLNGTAKENKDKTSTEQMEVKAVSQDMSQTAKSEDGTVKTSIKITEASKQEPQVIPVKIIETQPKEQVEYRLVKSTTQAIQKPKTVFELQKPKERTPMEEKAREKANTKPEKATMGFRAEVSKIEFWRAYADATDTELGIMCTAAIDEYIQRHELTADQKEIIDIKMKALKAVKRIKESI